MADIAEIGFRAPTDALAAAERQLDRLAPAAGRAEKASERLGLTLDNVDRTADALTAAAMALVSATERMASASTKGASAVDRAATANDNAAAASKRATGANDNQARSVSALGKQYDALAGKMRAIRSVTSNDNFSFARDRGADIAAYGAELDRLRSKFNPVFAVIQQYRSNIDEIRQANAVGAISVDEMTAAISRQRQAALTAIGAIKGTGTSVAATGAALAAAGGQVKLRTDEMLNLSRQAADVGVTLAMGMSPLMVAIQQGPQIADIFASASQRGIGFAAVLRQIGASAMAALTPILPILLPIVAAVGLFATGFALGAREINKSAGDITGSLNLTEKQMERLKKSGVDTTVTLGDTFRAFFQVLGERIAWLLSGPITTLSNGWNSTMDGITSYGAAAIKDIVGTFGGGYRAIVALWRTLPNTFAGIGALIANGFIAVIEGMINRAITEVNGINSKLNTATSALGLGNVFTMLDPVKIERVANAQAQATANAVSQGYRQGYAEASAATDRFFNDVRKRATKNRRDIIADAAGDAEKARKEREKKEKEREQLYMREPEFLYDVRDEFQTPKIDIDKLAEASPLVTRWYDDYIAGLENAREMTRGFVNDLRQGLQQGENFFKTFGNAVMNVLDRVIDKMFDFAIDSLFQPGSGVGGFLSGIFGSLGGAGKSLNGFRPDFTPTSSPIVLTAKGAAFGANGIVSSPTMYGISGGGMGVMGEDGTEAVMPLVRGPDGSLGVQANGGAGGGTTIYAPVSIHNDNRVEGAMSSEDIIASQRRAAENTKRELARELPSIIERYNRDGGIAA